MQGVTEGYKRLRSGSNWLQGVLWGYKEEPEIKRSYKELKEVTGGYKGQQGDPRSYRGVQRGYRVVAGGYRWF